jgi:hypothetical protein
MTKQKPKKKLRNSLILIGIFIILLIFSLIMNSPPKEKEIKVEQTPNPQTQSNVTNQIEQLAMTMIPLIWVAIIIGIGSQVILPFFRNQGVI